MVHTRDEMVDALDEEVLSELACSFFGARCSIDDEVELFEARAADLELAGQRVTSLLALLNEAFIEPHHAQRFWAAINVPESFVALASGQRVSHYHAVPWALTLCRRYVKFLERLYASLVLAVERYRSGTDYQRTDGMGRSRLVGWDGYQKWAEELNARIDAVNANQSPSAVLGFARGLDMSGAEKARVVGAAINGYSDAIDDNLNLHHVDGSAAGLGPVQPLPSPDAVRSVIRSEGRAICAAERRRVMALLDRLSRLAEVS